MTEQDKPRISTTGGSVITPQYAKRSMKCYAVTDSELKQIGLANLFGTISFGVGTALLGFGIDIWKDSKLASSLPEEARTLTDVAQPLCLIFGIVFIVAALAIAIWRRDMIKTIKDESGT